MCCCTTYRNRGRQFVIVDPEQRISAKFTFRLQRKFRKVWGLYRTKNLSEDFTKGCTRECRVVLCLDEIGFSGELNDIAALKGSA